MEDDVHDVEPKGAFHSEQQSVESKREEENGRNRSRDSNKKKFLSKGSGKLKFKVTIKHGSNSGNLACRGMVCWLCNDGNGKY